MSEVSQFQLKRCITPVTLADGTDTTTIADLGGTSICGISVDGTLTNAVVKLLVSDTYGGTYRILNDVSGSDITITLASNKRTNLASIDWDGIEFLKLNTPGGNQTGSNVTINIISKPTT